MRFLLWLVSTDRGCQNLRRGVRDYGQGPNEHARFASPAVLHRRRFRTAGV